IRGTFAKASGEPPGLFSFNSIGACPVCRGKGVTQPDVAFADPVTVTCEACGGTRYSDEALSHTYKGKNIVEMLQLTANQAKDFVDQYTSTRRIQTRRAVGLGYLTLGQIISSISGSDAQRSKLARQ